MSTLKKIYTAVLSSLKSYCDCYIDDNSLISDSLSCSRVVDSSTLYKAGLTSVGSHNASDVLNILTDWMKHDPYLTLNNAQYKIDTNCEVLAESASQSECSGAVSIDDSSSSDKDDKVLLYGLVGLGGGIVIFVLIVICLLFIWKRHRSSSFHFSRALK